MTKIIFKKDTKYHQKLLSTIERQKLEIGKLRKALKLILEKDVGCDFIGTYINNAEKIKDIATKALTSYY
jgi:hypothetical protein